MLLSYAFSGPGIIQGIEICCFYMSKEIVDQRIELPMWMGQRVKLKNVEITHCPWCGRKIKKRKVDGNVQEQV